ncbi:uncharacterized protein A1O9_08746 [Exophiala aquamarina CBS 119918]|uniref:MmgE/PrpD family protein n=1 Tax=Exophiala aquamarina CBS 119918 TaxID=1182545 RepID=A0A072P733_9EURO|nr:uncharacterized protein A1O9_08746 [Exophiala aquamarina CBS 119918]KEF55093.1 hypothetical protein A1O9_08746 [Exophiala aquamarina CBS 119918]
MAAPSAMEDRRPKPTLTRLAVGRLEKLRSCELKAEVREKAVQCLIDYLGALVTGLSATWSASLLQYAEVVSPSKGSSHVMGLNSTLSAEVAAFTNAALAHSIIRDDMHLSAGAHIGVMVMPAALALAQRERWTGDQLLRSIVGGYEMAVMLGSSVRHSGTCNPHFRPSGIIGAFGATAVGIVGDPCMTIDQATSALGFGANMAAGLNEWPWAGGQEINTHMGISSRSGIASYDLAKAGMVSSGSVLEGKDGLFQAYNCGPGAVDRFRDFVAESSLGFGIMGVKFKPIAGCNLIQTPVAAALRLYKHLAGSSQKIERVVIVTTTVAKEYPGCDSLGPFEKIQQTKMSLQYSVSAALLFGRIDEHAYRQYNNANLERLIQRCNIQTSREYDQELAQGRQPCRVEIHMEGGGTHQHSLADVPWLDSKAVEDRFRQEAPALYDASIVESLLAECYGLGSTADCKSLFELLGCRKT